MMIDLIELNNWLYIVNDVNMYLNTYNIIYIFKYVQYIMNTNVIVQP